MEKVIVDTNIVFSSILNPKSKISDALIYCSDYFAFYSSEYLKEELNNHKDKIIRISKYSETQFSSIFQTIVSKIIFIDKLLIPKTIIENSIKLVNDIDKNDFIFIALSEYLDGWLWTGDKKLILGLKNKGFKKVLTTEELYELYFNKS